VAHAADIPTKQKERLNKNDRVDSKKLGRSLHNHDLIPIYIPSRKAEEFRYLNRYRKQTIKDQSRLKNRIKSALFEFGFSIPLDLEGRRWSGAFIQWLRSIRFETEYAQFAFNDLIDHLEETRTRVKHILKKMRAMAKEESFNKLIPLLRSVSGIGFISAMTLATEIMDMARFSKLGKLANYIGLVPSTQSSDEKEIILGISQRRNKVLRSILIEAAWIAVREDPALMMKFAELCKRMPRNKAIVRIAKKLLSRIRYVWLNQEPYVYSVIE
jgi:transposase